MNKKEVGLLAVIVLVLGGLLFLIPFKMAKTPTNGAPKITPVEARQLPGGFPANVPIEIGAYVVQNYTAVSNGRVQATRVFISQKSSDQNFAFYDGFIRNAQNGWTMLGENSDSQGGFKAIFARNASGTLSININPGNTAGTSLISINFSAKAL